MGKQTSKNLQLNIDVSKAYRKLSSKKFLYVMIALLLLIVVVLCDLLLSSSSSNPIEIFLGLASNDSNISIVIWKLRMPHVLCSILAGATLGICGSILQSCLGNPLASSSTIGVSQGSSFGACLSIIVFGAIGSTFNPAIILFAFGFGVLPALLIFIFSKKMSFNPTTIILAGVAMSIFFGGLIALIEYFADSSKVAEVIFWTFGSVHNATYLQLAIIAAILVILLIVSMVNFINFNALTSGDSTAHSLGISTKKYRLIFLIISAFASACVTAFCGTINFIGLLAPHIMKRFVSLDYKYLIPSSAICGAILLSLSDLISSVILPGAILPIGAITSIIGAPVFVWMLVKGNK